MGVYGCSCSIVCTTNASVFWAILLALSTLYFETRSYWFDSFDSARLRGQWAPGIRQSPPPQCWGHRQFLQAPGFVTWVRGIRSLLFVFAPQFTNRTIPQLLIEDFLNTAEFPKQIPICCLNPPSVRHFVIITFEKQHRKNTGSREKRFLGLETLGRASLTALEMDRQHSTTTYICAAQRKAGHVPNTNDTHTYI